MTNTEIEEIRDRQKTTVNPQDTKLKADERLALQRELWKEHNGNRKG